ncbi:Pycsar system effector family protein [Pedobacter sp. ASV1-7]|uniref:Pycsar system effector family protein n=1 Tax=Pedobacter sp. ASV1-7 TaxID=3145237 RepID=UPI0032E8D8DE
MQYSEILNQLHAYVANLFEANNDKRFVYHNIGHTEQVVENTVKIASHYQLSDQDFFIVVAASWFHDMGYLFDCSQHEVRGERMAVSFLEEKGVDKNVINQVSGCIMATKMPQNPTGLLQQIVCDADLFHLGSSSFKEKNKLMRQEAQAFCNKEIDKMEWRIKTIALFKAHHYHTDYCKELLNFKKAQNLAEMEDKLNTSSETGTKTVSKTEKKKDAEKPGRGIETMFRISSANHQRLSDMADNKAHIMISTNSIILSVILSLLLRKLEDNPHLIIPTLLLLIICVVTMVFSILATRPSIPEGVFTQRDIDEKKVNLLFFGNFYRTSLTDYEYGMRKMMEDKDFLYGSLIKDVYAQGVVLGRKYRLLRVAYNVFMFGIVAAVLAFIIASAWVTL